MKSYTVHLREASAPVLVREGFSFRAMLFGPLWLAFQRSWLAAFTLAMVWVAVCSIRWSGQPVAMLVLFVCQGIFGADWWRRNLMIAGYDLAFVVSGRTENAAFARLLDEYPGLRSRMAL